MKPDLRVPYAFHLRALPTMAVCLVGGILAVGCGVRWLTYALLGAAAAAIVVATVLAKRRRYLGVACLVCLVVAATCLWRADAYAAKVTTIADTVTITGRVCGMRCDDGGTVQSICLDEVQDEDGVALHGQVQVNLGSDDWIVCVDGVETDYVVGHPLQTGNLVRVEGYLKTLQLDFFDSYCVHRIVRGVYYQQTADTLDVLPVTPKLSAAEKVRLHLYKTLRRSMSLDAAGMAYAFLTGGTGYLDSEIMQGYRSTGTAHLLAVSGLHIGVLAGVLLWLLRKMRTPMWAQAVTLAGVLGAYAWLCGGTPSVVRATVLAVGTCTAGALGCYRDKPSMLALCVLLMLTVQPLWLFDVSFLLSFGAYYGIVMLYRPLRALFRKLPRRMGDALALNLSVTISITPIGVYFFGGMSWLTVPINFVLVPLMSAVYVVLLVGAAAAMAVSAFGLLLWLPGLAVHFVNQAVNTVGQVGYMRFSTPIWLLPVWYAALTVASPYCLWSSRVKYTTAGVAIAGCLVLAIVL